MKSVINPEIKEKSKVTKEAMTIPKRPALPSVKQALLIKEKSDIMRKALEPLEKLKGVQIRGKGMILGLDVGDGTLARTIIDDCFSKGLLIATCGSGGRVIKLIPPLTIPERELMEGLVTLVNATQQAMEDAA